MSIPYPQLTIENEAELAASAIALVSDAPTLAALDTHIETLREVRALVVAGGLPEPLCPELTNANPGAPHVALLEGFAHVTAELAFRINQLPLQNWIAFANLFGIEPRAATAATTILRFTIVAPTSDTVVNIPEGTQVSTEAGEYVFATSAAAQRTGSGTVDVAATRTTPGVTMLAPAVLTKLVDVPAYVTTVSNLSAIDSGAAAETVEQTLERTRRYQRYGERIVTSTDLQEKLLDDALFGNGIVKVFPFIENGSFTGEKKPGYGTVIIMTRSGEAVDADTNARAAALLDQVVGNQFWYIVPPAFVTFDVTAKVRLQAGALSSVVTAAVDAALRAFYAASREQFGRGIYRTEIVAVIEGVQGVDRVVLQNDGQFLASPTADAEIASHQLAKLVNVTLTVV